MNINKVSDLKLSKEQFCLLLLCMIVFLLGIVKTLKTMDIHHWETIIFGAQNAFLEPYKSLYIQYGMLSNYLLYPLIKFATVFGISPKSIVGIFFSAVFSIILVTQYLVSRRVVNQSVALTLSLAFFLVYPRIQYPWPDYLAGLFLFLTLFIFLKAGKFSSVWACLLINLALFSREASVFYLLSVCSIFLLLYCFTAFNYLKELRYIIFAILAHYIVLFLFLGDEKSISYFLLQTFNFSPVGIEANSSFYFFIKKYLFFIYMSEHVNIYFFVCSIFLSLLFIVHLTKKQNRLVEFDKKVLMIFLFGLSGYAMSVHIPEIFRFQIYSFPIFIAVFAYFYRYIDLFKRKFFLFAILFCSLFLVFNIENNFRDASGEGLEDYPDKYVNIEGYRMTKEIYEFYKMLSEYSSEGCLYNLTPDPLIEKIMPATKFNSALPYFSKDFINRLPYQSKDLIGCEAIVNKNLGVACHFAGRYPQGIPFISGSDIYFCKINDNSILQTIN